MPPTQTESTEQIRQEIQKYVQREQKLRFWTWLSLAIPVGIFIVFAVLAGQEMKTYSELKENNSKLTGRNEGLQREIEDKERKLKVSDFAVNAVKAQRSGPAPTVMYYKVKEKPILGAALEQLGFKVIENSEQANPGLKGKESDTLIYGCGVSQEDLRIIGAALIKGGIQIRRMGPARKRPEPNLVQLVASVRTNSRPGGPSFSLRLAVPHDNVGCPILAGSPARAIFARWGEEQGWDSMSCPVDLRS